MAAYQIYARASIGRLVASREITCRTDAKAMEKARNHLIDGTQTELWCGDRYVGRVSAEPTPSSILASVAGQAGRESPAV